MIARMGSDSARELLNLFTESRILEPHARGRSLGIDHLVFDADRGGSLVEVHSRSRRPG